MNVLAAVLATPLLTACAGAGQAPPDEGSLSDVYRSVRTSVVTIRTVQRTGPPDARGQFTSERGVGSGVLISADGAILTAAHVVHTADRVQVEFYDGRVADGRVVGSVKAADVALVELVGPPPDDVTVARLGDSDGVRVADRVFVVGAPLGITHTLTVGYVSARRRPTDPLGLAVPLELIQTDAAINPGNSGGPMFDLRGEVVGVVSHIVSSTGGSEGLGFAIASNVARELLLERRAFWSGLEEVWLTGEFARAFNLPAGRGGVLVQYVAQDSPAERIGLRGGTIPVVVGGQEILIGGDVILDACGVRCDGPEALDAVSTEVTRLSPDADLTLRVLRDGEVVVLSAKLRALTAP